MKKSIVYFTKDISPEGAGQNLLGFGKRFKEKGGCQNLHW